MKKRTSLLLLAILVISLLAGCGGGGGNTGPVYTILSGKIIDAATQLGVSGATFSVGSVATATTDGTGNFTTPQFISGTYEITISKTGYTTKTYSNVALNTGTFTFDNPIPIQAGAGGESPAVIKDVPVAGGSGQITIAANKTVDKLVIIPYNTTLTAGTYSTTVSVSADSTSMSIVPVTSNIKSQNNTADPMISIRERERQLINNPAVKSAQINQNNRYTTSAFINDPDGTKKTFYKNVYGTWTTVTATKKYGSATSRCQIYLQDGVSKTYLDDSDIADLGAAFDSFYDRETAYFGNPKGTLGDIDGNDMIYILITDLETYSGSYVAGYFSGVNEFLQSSIPPSYQSNQKEMLYITTYKPGGMLDVNWLSMIKGTMAHEFQHLIYFNNRYDTWNTDADYDSEIWINEGLSMVSEDLAIKGPGYVHNSDLDDRVIDYLGNSTKNSLCTWGNSVDDYSPAYMFMRYFIDRYGEDKITNLISSSQTGNNMLTSVATGTTFNQLFRDWLAAVAFDRLGYSRDATFNEKYLYKTLDLSTYASFGTKSTGSLSIPDSTGGFIVESGLSGRNEIKVSISGNSVFGLRLLMVPVGASFSEHGDLPHMTQIR